MTNMVLNMKNNVGTDVNQVKITSLSHIQAQPQVIDNLELNLCAHFNIMSSPGNSNLSFWLNLQSPIPIDASQTSFHSGLFLFGICFRLRGLRL